MGVISTKDLMQMVYDELGSKGIYTCQIIKSQIDKPVLYDYEKEIQTELVDMNVDQLIGLIDRIMHHKQRESSEQYLSLHSYDPVKNALFYIFEVYIGIHPMRNPIKSAAFRKDNIRTCLMQDKTVIDHSMVQELVRQMRIEYPMEQAEYYELLMQLFYCGFQSFGDIVNLEESQINHKIKTVSFSGYSLRLTDRCYTLLMRFQNLSMIQGIYKKYYLTSWRGKFFQYMLTESMAVKWPNKTENEVVVFLRSQYSTYVLKPHKMQINNTVLFYLGLYDYMVKKYGPAKTNDMIVSNARQYSNEWQEVQLEYGITRKNTMRLKDALLPYVHKQEES